MSVEVHCTHCGQKIRVPDERAGRYGTCPGCDQRIYIPSPADESEEIGLAPVDEEEERRARRRRAKDQAIERQLLEGGPGAVERAAQGGSATPTPRPSGDPDDLADLLVRYVRGMTRGRMAACDEIVASLVGRRQEVAKAAQRLIGESPPRQGLSGMPPAVVKGYLKQLLGQL